MATLGKKPEKMLRAWKVLTEKTKNSLDKKTVHQPLELLKLNGPMSYGTASQILTKLEKANYLRKHTNGSTRLVYVTLLKTWPLGEDILGKQEEKKPAQRSELPVSPSKKIETSPEPEQKHPRGIHPRSNGVNGVVVLCDYENFRNALSGESASLDYSDLIARARGYGNVIRSTAFIPMHVASEVQMKLRIAGFRIESCPPRKPFGKDTCDQAIEEAVRFYLDYTNIGTFVVISGDGDFADIIGEIENSGKKSIVFHYNYGSTSKNLISKTGSVINLAEILPKSKIAQVAIRKQPEPINWPEIHATNGIAPDVYNQMLDNLKNNRGIIDRDDIRWKLLTRIIRYIKNDNLDCEDATRRKSLSDLKEETWRKISGDFGAQLSSEDCRLALSALRDFSVIKSKAQSGNPRTYYVFNPNNELINHILS